MTMLRFPSGVVACVAAAAALVGCSGYGYGQQPGSASGGAGASSTSGPAPAAAPVVQCNAQPAQFAVGQNSTATVVESARARSGAQLARILRPGQIVTKEFDAQRLNLEVDSNGRILAVRCG